MSHPVTLGKTGWFSTDRRDNWWIEPLLVVVGLSAFGVYSTLSAVFWQSHFEYGPYLSPFYEPLLLFNWWPFSPALLILWAPLGFRATCYYYRGAYYKAFFMNPPACAVTGQEGKGYTGEGKFPFVLMNFHRFFLIAALFLNVFLWIGAIRSFWYEGSIGIGVGSVIMVINAHLLMMYSLSCHSIRHFIGGRLDCFTCTAASRTGHAGWKQTSKWNEHHKRFAWFSLVWVGLTDVYIRLVAHGIIPDLNTWSSL
ncbi:MAG: succinate dehydrogenase [bacterium]|nr:succinate dehydrogenase [bacterium]